MNVIVFNPDELRAESIGCYGHPLAPTPHLDRLATEGRASSSATPSIPSAAPRGAAS